VAKHEKLCPAYGAGCEVRCHSWLFHEKWGTARGGAEKEHGLKAVPPGGRAEVV